MGAAKIVELGEAGLFWGRIEIGVYDIKANDAVTTLDQPPGGMITYEAGGAGDEDSHGTLSHKGALSGLLLHLNNQAVNSKGGPSFPCSTSFIAAATLACVKREKACH